MGSCLTVVRLKRRISSIIRIGGRRKGWLLCRIYWSYRYEFIRNTTFCRDDGVVVVGDDASPAGVWQIQPVAGKFWINWRRDRCDNSSTRGDFQRGDRGTR